MDPVATAIQAAAAAYPPLLVYVPAALAVVGLVAAVCPFLPHPTGPGAYSALYTTLNLIGQNYGHAENAAPAPIPAPAEVVAAPKA